MVLTAAVLAWGCRQGAAREAVDAGNGDGIPDAAVDGGERDASHDRHDAASDATVAADAHHHPIGDLAVDVGDAETGHDASGPAVNECLTFEDRTAPDADRTLAWNFDLSASPERCIQIARGQSVTWSGVFRWHPLSALGGDLPSPIPGLFPDEGDHSIAFSASGTYGFICEVHTEMRGAVRVVP